jgi:hypothetical protein
VDVENFRVSSPAGRRSDCGRSRRLWHRRP